GYFSLLGSWLPINARHLPSTADPTGAAAGPCFGPCSFRLYSVDPDSYCPDLCSCRPCSVGPDLGYPDPGSLRPCSVGPDPYYSGPGYSAAVASASPVHTPGYTAFRRLSDCSAVTFCTPQCFLPVSATPTAHSPNCG